MEKTLQLISTHKFANVVFDIETKQHALVATKSFEVKDELTSFSAGEMLSEPNYLTVQIGKNEHITLVPQFLQYVNHSCEPNVFFNTKSMKLVCIKKIEVGDELRFFYPSSEWEMAQSFICNCGAQDCLKLIQDAKFLTKETIEKHIFTDFIKQQLFLKQD